MLFKKQDDCDAPSVIFFPGYKEETVAAAGLGDVRTLKWGILTARYAVPSLLWRNNSRVLFFEHCSSSSKSLLFRTLPPYRKKKPSQTQQQEKRDFRPISRHELSLTGPFCRRVPTVASNPFRPRMWFNPSSSPFPTVLCRNTPNNN